MRIDFIRRLALTLGGLSIAVAAVVGTLAVANERIPIVSSSEIPFDPFSRVPVVQTAPPATPVVSSDSTSKSSLIVPAQPLSRATSTQPAATANAGSGMRFPKLEPLPVISMPKFAKPVVQRNETSQRSGTASELGVEVERLPVVNQVSNLVPIAQVSTPSDSGADLVPIESGGSFPFQTAPEPVVVQPVIESMPAMQSQVAVETTSAYGDEPAPVVVRSSQTTEASSGATTQIETSSRKQRVIAPALAKAIEPLAPAALSLDTTAATSEPVMAEAELSEPEQVVTSPVSKETVEAQVSADVVLNETSVETTSEATLELEGPADSVATAEEIAAVEYATREFAAEKIAAEEELVEVKPLSRKVETTSPASADPESEAESQEHLVSFREDGVSPLPSRLPGLPISRAEMNRRSAPANIGSSMIVPETHAGAAETMMLPEGASMVDGEIILDGELGSVVNGSILSDCCRSCPPRTYLVGEGLLFRHEGDFTQMSNQQVLDGFDYKEGGRATFGRRSDCLNGWNVSAMAIEPWYNFNTVNSPGGSLRSTFVAGGGLTSADISEFLNANTQSTLYQSDMLSVEYNREYWGWDVITTSYGFRYLSLDENLLFTSNKGPGSGSLNIETNNNLIGAHLGMEAFYDIGNRLYFSSKSRLGAFANINDGAAQLVNSGNTGNAIAFVNTDQNLGFSAILDLQINAFYKLTDRARIRGGYEIWYMYGLATANDQVKSTLLPSLGRNIDDENDFFMHGLSAGIEFVW